MIKFPKAKPAPRGNVPLTHAQVKALPVAKCHVEPNVDKDGNKRFGVKVVTDYNGYSPTSNGVNNRMRRAEHDKNRPNNRATTNGRVTQFVPIKAEVQTKFGKAKVKTGRYRKVRHNNPDIKNQAFTTFDK